MWKAGKREGDVFKDRLGGKGKAEGRKEGAEKEVRTWNNKRGKVS